MTWRTDLIALHALSDFVIFLSYFIIPTALLYLYYKRSDLVQSRIILLFSAFILACGLTHLVGLITLWNPVYGFEGVVKAGTAVVSGLTAVASWMLMPAALKLPSAQTLRLKNDALGLSIAEQRRANAELETIKAELEIRIQERTRELQSKAEALERMNASLSDYAHFASHDLQEPLRKIVSFSELAIEQDTTGDAEQRLYLEKINESARRARTLVRNILHHAEIDQHTVDIQDLSLRAETEATLENLELAINDRQGRIDTDIPDIMVRADPSLVAQVLQNIIGNAIKYTPADRVPEIAITTARTDQGVDYIIKDNGMGFDPTLKDRIFQPFMRLHSNASVDGTGMGLAIVVKALGHLGWSISVDTVETQGTQFTISIPEDQIVSADASGE
ncbi:MAG: hypothetical protein KUA43_09655 [Hoeflea sp.]|uniref:sensor histidine kinase n=1 Tax=Hoeflea sp. TaxID=1940281 RepID=UPI001DDDF95D|nr:ATP-binding protein [Hoeflea sp.]MBU4528441.1 hypothetical protein [Alphaproteobacteria bacterium]MBU4543110.1 hypothetical protein [Alphaproteobacteria bacterium]MBU4551801.1 hypothetical protein [Alphaproteobacteria bacterium]MBV1723696.1 hypothetical protein [Hoeflea sp.]MBV1762012.1 hypothetical protein [Hoeflea sp.]